MKVLYDTSVLIPALLVGHDKHSMAFPQLETAKRGDDQGYLSTHSLAEVYAVVTRLPQPLGISPESAKEITVDLLEYLVPVALSVDDYRQAIAPVTSLNLTDGVMYNAVIAQPALNASVERLATLNPKDFVRLGDEVSRLVHVPE